MQCQCGSPRSGRRPAVAVSELLAALTTLAQQRRLHRVAQDSTVHQLRRDFHVGCHLRILLEKRNPRPHHFECGGGAPAHARSRSQRAAAKVDGLRGRHEFDSQNVAQIPQHAPRLSDRDGTVRHVILHVGRGGDAVGAGGKAQRLVFAAQGRGGVLRQHEARMEATVFRKKRRQKAIVAGGIGETVQSSLRNVAVLRHGETEVIKGDGQGLAVKVPATEGHGGSVRLEKKERIVRHAVELNVQNSSHVGNGVGAGAVDLRHAAQRVGILRVFAKIRPEKLRSFQQGTQLLGGLHLVRLGSDLVDPSIQGGRRSVQCFHRKSPGDVGNKGAVLGLGHGQASQSRHEGRAVGQRQTLLGGQFHGRQAHLGQGLDSRQYCSVHFGAALPNQHQRHVRERRQVATGAQRALPRHHGVHPALHHLQQQLQRLESHSRNNPTPACWRESASWPGPLPVRAAWPTPTACERTMLRCSCLMS